MVRRSLRAGLWLGLLMGMGWALRRAMLLRRVSESAEVSNDPWSPIAEPPAAPPEATAAAAAPEPAAPAPAPAPDAVAAAPAPAPPTPRTWVEPQDGTCPPTHPIKVKLASGIFHLPGMLAYDRTKPDRCYATEGDAVADGFVKAKR